MDLEEGLGGHDTSAAGHERWSTLASALAAPHAGTLPQLERSLEKAFGAGARPFEVVVGAPAGPLGARITFSPGDRPEALAAAFGLADHPWGAPSWVGVRARSGAALHAKAYHCSPPPGAGFALPAGLPEGLRPVMASLDGDAYEVYLRLAPARTWGAFAGACVAAFTAASGCASAPAVSPRPRPSESGLGLSLRWSSGRLSALSLFARGASLPDEAAIARAWTEGLADDDARAYALALAGVRSIGRLRGGAWHAMLTWTLEAGGPWRRAVSLAVPV